MKEKLIQQLTNLLAQKAQLDEQIRDLRSIIQGFDAGVQDATEAAKGEQKQPSPQQ